ncbi:MAG: HD domain-containing protein [Lachnospiraceae bacterium]|nr:HD domain-containing protein [Lachnospiraceae bacterium]
MSERKNYQIVMFVIMMILMNYFGKTFAEHFELPVWFDSLGTVVAAYVCDPFCGAVVGLTGNVAYGLKDPQSLVYGLASIAIGLSVGICARKKLFETPFGTLTASVIVTLISVTVSVPINLLFGNSMVGNKWGDGVVTFFLERDVPAIAATALGEFYVDFLDKVVSLFLLYLMIQLFRFRRRLKGQTARHTGLALFLTILAASLLPSGTARANSNDINNNNIQTIYSSDNGLPCGEANDVIQTNDGILWVGTYAGLYRYNGSEFRLMGEYDSVRNVNCLFVDEEGRLWIGTNDNGVSIAIQERIANVIDVDAGLPANSVRSITMSTEGRYYVGTTSSMSILTLDGGMSIVKEFPEIVYAHSSSAGPNDMVAAVTNDGDLFLLQGEEIIARLRLNAEQEIFTCAEFRSDGMLYVGTSSNRVFWYDVSEGTFEEQGFFRCRELNHVNRICFRGDKMIYVCSDTGVGYRDDSLLFRLLNLGDFRNSIDNMTVDYQGNLWFSSSRLGLLKLSASPFSDVYRSADLQARVVNAVTKWQKNLYVGTDEGLDIIDTMFNRSQSNKLTELLSGVRIRCLLPDKSNNLWICTYGKGVLCVDEYGEVTTFDGSNGFGDWARVVIELSDGRIAAACDTSLGFFRGKELVKQIRYDENLSKSMILCLTELSDGRIMVGTDGDGIAVIQQGKPISHLNRENGLSSDVILRIVQDPVQRGAYIVTSNGLCYMDSKDEISILENFPYYNNYDVWAFEDGKLFVLSSGGIYVTERAELFRQDGKIDYELLDAKRGLSVALTANSWDYLEKNGDMYLSCDNGVYCFNIHDYGVVRRSYRMKISSIFLDGKEHEIERGEEFHVSSEVAKLEIFPEIINYTMDDPNISYYLEGFEPAPNVTKQSGLTSIIYTNLPAGTYTFHFSVLDNKSEKVLEESVFTLVKEQEFHNTATFQIYMVVVAMLAVAWLTWLIARTQIQRTLNFQKKELEFAKNQVKMGNETILAIAKTVDAKDENTSQHSQRVSDYSVLIARELGFSDEECENLRKAALLHDIGKIGIPDRVLNKPARLDDKEYSVMKSHVTRGAEILKDFTLVEHAVEGTLYHHEHYDGTGYPQGLKGEEIPIYGRIIGVADAFDAMTANRVYRDRLDFHIVLDELRRCSGKQFDPKMITILFRLIREGKIDVDALYGTHIELPEWIYEDEEGKES